MNNLSLANLLIPWFHQNKRDLPFRKEKNPYKIWLSEIMAQQTQIATLIPYYNRFLEQFPTVTALASAPEDMVLKYWEGLGYYSRAKNLHKAAKMICDQYDGIFPKDPTKILKLPGIGPYTAGAIASICFNLPIPAVDGNVLRVIARIYNITDDITLPETKKKITHIVKNILASLVETSAQQGTPGDFNEGLMELGALICTPTTPNCCQCPLHEICAAFQNHCADKLPIKTKKAPQKRLMIEVGAVAYDNHYYLIKRPEKIILAGLWAFPSCETEKETSLMLQHPDPNQMAIEHIGKDSNQVQPGDAIAYMLSQKFSSLSQPTYLGKSKHTFTHIIWEMYLYGFSINNEEYNKTIMDAGTEAFVTIEEILNTYALPTAFKKMLKLIEK